MCAIISVPPITVCLSLDEARRIGDLNIDLDEVEIIRWRRKVRDAVRHYDLTGVLTDGNHPSPYSPNLPRRNPDV